MRHVNVPPQRWQTILSFARAHIAPGHFAWEPMEVSELFDVIHNKKAGTSAGLMGSPCRTLKRMPKQVLQAFCDIFASAECDGRWPSQLVDGKVVSLAKVATLAHLQTLGQSQFLVFCIGAGAPLKPNGH